MTFGVRAFGSGPGVEAQINAEERLIQHNIDLPEALVIIKRVTVVSTTTDAGNPSATPPGPATTLRAGLPLAKVTATGKYTNWDAEGDATDGTANCAGFVFKDQDMLSHTGTAEDKLGVLLVVGGVLKASMITTLNQLARNQLRGRIIFDDDLEQSWQYGPFAGMKIEIVTGTERVLTAADAGTFFVSTHADLTTFTLPQLVAGGGFECVFFNVGAAGIAIDRFAGDDDLVITYNEAAADSLVVGDSGDFIGGGLIVKSIDIAGTFKWLATGLGASLIVPAG